MPLHTLERSLIHVARIDVQERPRSSEVNFGNPLRSSKTAAYTLAQEKTQSHEQVVLYRYVQQLTTENLSSVVSAVLQQSCVSLKTGFDRSRRSLGIGSRNKFTCQPRTVSLDFATTMKTSLSYNSNICSCSRRCFCNDVLTFRPEVTTVVLGENSTFEKPRPLFVTSPSDEKLPF